MTSPPDQIIKLALTTAAQSTCRSKRGVVVYYSASVGEPVIEGVGFNGPPRGMPCPGREICSGTCGQRCVHAEIRALRLGGRNGGNQSELVHVELAADGNVVACDGPGCWQCSREILDVGFVAGVWLYEAVMDSVEYMVAGAWRRYTSKEFHRVTLGRCGIPLGKSSV